MAESNETIVSLSQARDLYHSYVDINICNELIDTYDKASRQLYNLSLVWSKFSQRKEKPNRETSDETSSATPGPDLVYRVIRLIRCCSTIQNNQVDSTTSRQGGPGPDLAYDLNRLIKAHSSL